MAEQRKAEVLIGGENAVNKWIDGISKEGKFGLIDPSILLAVLEAHGAKFDAPNTRLLWEKSTPRGRRMGLVAVWGEARVSEYEAFIKEIAQSFEGSTDHEPLPGTTGLVFFLADLTAFAAKGLPMTICQSLIENRAKVGRNWQSGVRGVNRKVAAESFPPGFPSRAWEEIKQWKPEQAPNS